MRSAASAGRLRRWRTLLAGIEADFTEEGPITLLALRPALIMPAAYELVVDHRLRTLHAIHLAVAVQECPQLAGDEEFTFITRDEDQARAARQLGLAIA